MFMLRLCKVTWFWLMLNRCMINKLFNSPRIVFQILLPLTKVLFNLCRVCVRVRVYVC